MMPTGARLRTMDETTLEGAAGRFSGLLSDPRRVAGVIIMAGCLGVIIGYRLAAGAESFTPPPNPFGGPVPEPRHDCAECRERKIRAELAAEIARNAGNVARASAGIHADARSDMAGMDPPAPVLNLDPDPVPFDHARPAPSAATFSAMATPVVDAPVGVPVGDE